MQSHQLPIGYDDFGAIIKNKLNFIDKSLFIKDVIDNNAVYVTVITRPRRFGKTLNLSMLHHFLASEVNQQKTAQLFDGLKISTIDNGSYMQHQGKFPVIFVSFKEVKDKTFASAVTSLHATIQELFCNHLYLSSSDKISDKEKNIFANYFSDESHIIGDLKTSLRFLCGLLYKHFECKPYLLLDEYDTPIQSGYLKDYYNEIVDLMRSMLGAALKTNPYLERAVITGILRVAKESIFSDLNNVTVYSLLQLEYSQHFGFTETEVKDLLKQFNLTNKEQDIKKWYNGYIFGSTTVYNPWSIANCLKRNGLLQLYWGNTSDNQLIKNLLASSNPDFKKQLELLLQDKTIEKLIDEDMVFGDLKNNNQAIWSLLMMSGYLKIVSCKLNDRGKTICECAIPNWEIKTVYCDIIEAWLGNGHGAEWYQSFITDLLNGDIDKFIEGFGQVLSRTISFHDTAHNPESFYQGFMLGLSAGINPNQYEIKSNRESGLGRYDIAIIPKNISKLAIVLEIKSIAPPKLTKKKLESFLETTLTKEAQKALEQINRNQYALELVQRGLKNIVKIGLAFSGKSFKAVFENSKPK